MMIRLLSMLLIDERTGYAEQEPFEVASGPVYVNRDVSNSPNPGYDEVAYRQGEEVGRYPEGAYQTWSPSEKPEFRIHDKAADAVSMFDKRKSPEDVLDGEEP